VAIIIVLIVIIFQLYLAFRSWLSIQKLSSLFPEKNARDTKLNLIVSESIHEYTSGKAVKLIAINTETKVHASFRGIVDSVNQYLSNNKATTAEYTIMRDIAERISEAEESVIDSTISLPLYVGLMGTFIGVIFGLYHLKNGITDSGITIDSIREFLGGVFIAMSASFAGLFLTTINNSWFFKIAKAKRDYNKNVFLNFLQAELLPTLENTLSHNIQEFKTHLQDFNAEFSDNIKDFSGTIPNITENLRLQTDFIKRFQEINIPKLVNANVQIMDRLDESIKIFDGFNKYAKNLQKSFVTSDQMLDKVTQVLNRLANFEENIDNVGKLVQQNYEHYGKLGSSLAGNLSELQKRWQVVNEFVNMADSDVKEIANTYKRDFNLLGQQLQQDLSAAFDMSRQDNPLLKLNVLDSVNKNLELIAKKLENRSNFVSPVQPVSHSYDEMINEIKKLRYSIQPSIFRPKQFIQFVLGRNGYNSL
jgi:biopolymer transport protein ExbB/TolQ